MTNQKLRAPLLPKRQRGVATILIVIFVGIAITATALGILHSLRSTQERQISVHAQTHSQAAVWTGAEAFRQYLEGLDATALETFATTKNTLSRAVDINGIGDVALKAYAFSNIANGDGSYNMTINITAKDATAQAASNLQVVYKLTPKTISAPYQLTAAAGFYGDLNLSGGLNIDGPGSGNINVKGNLVAHGSVSGTGLGHVNATGDVLIGSDIEAESLTSNGNVVLTGSAKGDINAAGYPGLGKGNILMTASTTVSTNLHANGNILLTGSSPHGTVDARGFIESTGWPGESNLGVLTAANDDVSSDYFSVELNEGETFQDRLETEEADNTDTEIDSYSAQLAAGLRPYFASNYTANSPYSYSRAHFTALEDKCDNLTTADAVRACKTQVGKLETALTGRDTVDVFNRLNPDDLDPADPTLPKYPVNDIKFNDGPSSVAAKGFITVTGNSGAVGELTTTSGIDCGRTWANYTTIVSKWITGCGSATVAATAPTVPEVAELEPFVMPPPPVVNAWTQKGAAHYAFEPDGNKIKVKVQNINNIPAGDYYLGTYASQGANEYICSEVNTSNVCTLPVAAADAWPMCGWGDGTGGGNACFVYRDSDGDGEKDWVISGAGSLAPGIIWFEGDIEINSGNLFNTVIATGNIETTGSFKGAAVNFAGPSQICAMEFDFTHEGVNIKPTQGSNHTIRFQDQYPTECKAGAATTVLAGDTATDFFVKQIANMAFLSGGENPEGVFTGGNVIFSASSEVMGTVMSADVLDASGAATIYGYIIATGQGNGASNRMTAGAKINLNNLPPLYGDNVVNSDGETAGSLFNSEMLWSRYL